MLTAFREVFKRYAQIFTLEERGLRVYAFDALCLLKSMCCKWAEIYASVATYREKFLWDKALMNKEVLNLGQALANTVRNYSLNLRLTGRDSSQSRRRTLNVPTHTELRHHVTSLLIKLYNVIRFNIIVRHSYSKHAFFQSFLESAFSSHTMLL